MFDENVVNFTAYSALLMARLATFLDRLAAAVFAVVKDFDEEQDGSIQSFNAGFGVLQSWLRELLAEALP
jgi:hypothetical protein